MLYTCAPDDFKYKTRNTSFAEIPFALFYNPNRRRFPINFLEQIERRRRASGTCRERDEEGSRCDDGRHCEQVPDGRTGGEGETGEYRRIRPGRPEIGGK